MDLTDVTILSNGPVLGLIRWLQGHNLLANPLRCVPCNRAMDLNERNDDHVDGFLWRCPTCHKKKSLRSNSFFGEFPRLPLGKILLCLYLWSIRELRTTAANMLSLTKNTIGNIYALLRHYCGRDLQDRPIIPFGGRVYVVKCDESQFKHKSKVVPRRDRATLNPILQRVLLPGSEVHSDDWAAYRNLPLHVPNVSVHRVIVHKDHFVDPRTGIHTQEVESTWSQLKYHVKRERGIRRLDLQDFLNEEMWRQWRGQDAVLPNIQIISTYYPL